jgi:hypothetical protein
MDHESREMIANGNRAMERARAPGGGPREIDANLHWRFQPHVSGEKKPKNSQLCTKVEFVRKYVG